MRFGGNFGRRRTPGADGPHRLVRNQNTRELGRGQRAEAILELALQNGIGEIRLRARLSVSPTQTIGVRPASSAAFVLR